MKCLAKIFLGATLSLALSSFAPIAFAQAGGGGAGGGAGAAGSGTGMGTGGGAAPNSAGGSSASDVPNGAGVSATNRANGVSNGVSNGSAAMNPEASPPNQMTTSPNPSGSDMPGNNPNRQAPAGSSTMTSPSTAP